MPEAVVVRRSRQASNHGFGAWNLPQGPQVGLREAGSILGLGGGRSANPAPAVLSTHPRDAVTRRETNSEKTPLMDELIYAAPVAGVLALLFAFWKTTWVNSQDPGEQRMQEIAGEIRTGAMAFLAREYKVLALFVLIVAGLLAAANMDGEGRSPLIAASFVIGAFASGLAGFFGMRVATA